jgi:hypothetical protein
MVTLCSCIASSRADCVFGVARLISSARTIWANTGPGWKLKTRLPSGASEMMLVPMMSHEQTGQHAVDDFGVPDDDLANLAVDPAVGLAEVVGPFLHQGCVAHEWCSSVFS